MTGLISWHALVEVLGYKGVFFPGQMVFLGGGSASALSRPSESQTQSTAWYRARPVEVILRQPRKAVLDVLEQLHQIGGLPRLEIEGCKYPTSIRPDDPVFKNMGAWLKHDGYGGQVGSVSVQSQYLRYLDTEEGDRCAFVIKDKWERPDNYTTIVDVEYILFKKRDIQRIVEFALSDSKASISISGKRVVDDVIWDDSFPTGPCWKGPEIHDVVIELVLDLTEARPLLSLHYTTSMEI